MRVEVWVRRVADVPPDDDVLDPVERARLAGIVAPEHKRSYAAGHVLARRAVASVVGSQAAAIRFDRTCTECGEQHGRPTLLDHPEVTVSISRTDQVVAAAIGGPHPVGIDVETLAGTEFDGFPAVALHPDERASVELPPTNRLHRRAVAWARKEAALKALGTGLRADPAGLLTPPSGIRTVVLGVAVMVVDVALPWDDAVAAVAARGSETTIEVQLR